MNKEENNESISKHLRRWFIGVMIEQVISIAIAVVLCVNASTYLGYFNIGNARIKLADEARISNNYTESIEWYNKIVNSHRPSFQKYKPYANLALAEIYGFELENKNYERALDNYVKVTQYDESKQDVRIYYSVLRFVVEQIQLSKSKAYFEQFDVNSESFVDLTTDALNQISNLSPDSLLDYDVEFPLSKEKTKQLLASETKIKKTIREWKFVDTETTTDISLGGYKGNEKLELVDTWQEPMNSYSVSMVTYYKFNRYRIQTYQKDVSAVSVLEELSENAETIYPSYLKFDKNGNLIGEDAI
ncbi:MAG: hypothetical protein IJR70_05155 [Eubacterium sp.]|nr:hypothetical protein [Eubacterium sp.]